MGPSERAVGYGIICRELVRSNLGPGGDPFQVQTDLMCRFDLISFVSKVWES
jgi:hypothetical protein